ncbi:MAG: trypsin-like serine protease [Polyangiaceae bacterium]|nr:trypsin-like serine protease [Polyangiaceae bacterium]
MVLLALGTTVACGAAADEDAAPSADDDIVGGTAEAKTSPAIGALASVFPTGADDAYDAFCTATLVAPQVVVTAEHCCLGAPGGKLAFVRGLHGSTDLSEGTGPDSAIEVLSCEGEPSVLGGALGLGSDIAVAILKTPVTNVKPLPIGQLSTSDVGKPFIAVGYGLREGGLRGDRRTATLKLFATSGATLHALTSFEDYNSAFGGSEAKNRRSYDAIRLLDQYEIATGSGPGGPRLAKGDSGGPLLARRGGKLVVVGIASYVVGTPDDPGRFGSVHAVFGPAARDFVRGKIK